MELPDYSKQLMQQLQALRKEGNFCDCTILVGDVSHRAHKLVLAASSMLFRSLLDGSDTISIDTVVVSSQEFERLLDIVYTGRLPQGKHNISQIITTADNLQMFDVAIGCKNILASLLGQPTSPQLAPTMPPQTQTQTQTQLQVKTEEMGGTRPGKATVMSGPQGVNCTEEAEFGTESVNAAEARAEERRNGEGPSPKTIPVSVLGSPESFLPDKDQSAHRSKIEENNASVSHGSDSALPECSSGLKELLVEVPSMPELLTQAALDTLGEKEGEVVRQCCEGARAGTAANRLGARLREGALSGKGMLALLSAVREKSSSSCSPQLLSLLKQLERRTQQKEANASPQQPLSPSLAANSTNEDKEPEDKGCADGVVDMKVKPDSSPASPASPSQPYSCRWCKKGFSFKCRLRAHAKRCPKSQELKHQCPLCPKRLPTPRALQRHRAEVHPETARIKKKVACDLCGRTFAHPSGMIYHKRTEHFDEKPYSCEQCGAKFGANSSLKNHIRLHTGEKPYHCKHCDMTFSVAAALAYHTKKKHSEGKMYSCQYCEALFAQSIELTRHVRTHTGDRPYVCRECGKGYSQASGLTVHLQTFHNILEPHDCQKCRLSFRSLEEHQQHIQECHPKDFHRCAICHKVFTSAALLDKHKGTHTGLKPYSCDLCHKSYQQLSGLWYHNRTTHPEVYASQTRISLKTLVQCDICFKFFPNTCSLSSHQVAEHSESAALAVRCPHCPAIFAGQEEMLEHAGSQHFASDCPAFGCSLCPLVCPTQLQLQEHFLSCHTGALAEQGGGDDNKDGGEGAQASTSNEVTPAVGISLDQSQLAGPQQVFVSLGDGEGGGSSSEVVAVNVDDLLNGTITFICGDKQ